MSNPANGSAIAGNGRESADGLIAVPFALFFFVFVFASWRETKAKDSRILEQKPMQIIFRIILCQLLFLLTVFVCVLTTTTLAGENFNYTQVWTSFEYDFITPRGLASTIGCLLSYFFTSFSLVHVVIHYLDTIDHSFTIFFFHTITVYAASGKVPTSAWWFANSLGFFILLFVSFILAYKINTMPYRSSLGGRGKKSIDGYEFSSTDDDEDEETELKNRLRTSSMIQPRLSIDGAPPSLTVK